MLVDAIIATTGVAVLLPLTFSGLIAAHGRRSDNFLLAPRGARFGDATRLVRAAVEAERATGRAADKATSRTVANAAVQTPDEATVPTSSRTPGEDAVRDTGEAANEVTRTPLVAVRAEAPFTRSDRRAA